MNLWLKLLVPINVAILVVWLAHTWWEVDSIERDFMGAEANALTHLAKGLASVHRERTGRGYAAFNRAAAEFGTLEVMLVDRRSVVLASNVEGRRGRAWRDAGIDAVLSGSRDSDWRRHDHAGTPVLDASVPVVVNGEVRSVVHVAKPLRALDASVAALRRRHIAFAGLLLVAVSVVVNILTFWFVIRPLRAVHERLRRDEWQAEHRGKRHGDEVQRLDRAVTEMLDEIHLQHTSLRDALEEKEGLLSEVTRLRDGLAEEVEHVRTELSAAQDSLLRAERLNLLSNLSAALAHELRNPLHIMRGTAETIARRHPKTAELVTYITEEGDRVERLIKELLDYARPLTPSAEPIDARELLARIRKRGCRRTGCTASCSFAVRGERCELCADPVLIEQALINLVTNACEAGPPIEMSVERDDSGGTRFTVTDNGPGIASTDLARVFEPFYTTKTKGTGLGLPVVQRIAELHGGTVALRRREGGGTVATLYIPERQP